MEKPNIRKTALSVNADRWANEIDCIREILSECDLKEEVKWQQPCYTHRGKNILIIGAFNDACVLTFFKGVLLSDPAGLLTKPGEQTQSARTLRFTGTEQIISIKNEIKAFVSEAIENEKSGKKAVFKKTEDYPVPVELQEKLDEAPVFAEAFYKLTPGRQRAYLLYFSQPVQSSTRQSRIEKMLPAILQGKGLNDR